MGFSIAYTPSYGVQIFLDLGVNANVFSPPLSTKCPVSEWIQH